MRTVELGQMGDEVSVLGELVVLGSMYYGDVLVYSVGKGVNLAGEYCGGDSAYLRTGKKSPG